MNDQNIVFSQFEYIHGIHKPKIVIFTQDNSPQFYLTLNRQIEQLKIKALFNVGNEEIKQQLNAQIIEQLNPNLNDLIELALQIKDYLFNKNENVGIISGPLTNNSLKLFLTFLHNHESHNDQIAQAYNQLPEDDKIELQQILNSNYRQPYIIGIQSDIRSIQQPDQDNESQIIKRESNQQSQFNAINSNTTKTVTSFVIPIRCIQVENEVGTDQILTSKEQAISQPFYKMSKINQEQQDSVIQNSIISMNLAPPNIDNYKLQNSHIDQGRGIQEKKAVSSQFIESNDKLKSPIHKDPQQHQIHFEEVKKVTSPPKKKEHQLPDPIKFLSFASSTLKCLQ